MHATDAITTALAATQNMLGMYLSDLGDGDLLVRPVANANHIAWQLGHLIHAEKQLLQDFLPGAGFPAIPQAIVEKDNKEASRSDTGFRTKGEYLDLFSKVRTATIAEVNKLSEADLDKPNTGVLAPFAPTLGALLLLVSNHTLMHAGQFTVVRRKLGKPVLF